MANWIDSIVPCLDALRQNAADTTGYRQYEVYVRVDDWSGSERGEGLLTTTEVRLSPPPRVVFAPAQRSFVVQAAGREETADVMLTEISLSYSESTLLPSLDSSGDVMYRLHDSHSQGVPDRFYVPVGSPRPDRLRTMGWTVFLRQRSNP